jgi:hypothetical protein
MLIVLSAESAAAAAVGVLRGERELSVAVRVPRGDDLIGFGRMMGVSMLMVSKRDKPAV